MKVQHYIVCGLAFATLLSCGGKQQQTKVTDPATVVQPMDSVTEESIRETVENIYAYVLPAYRADTLMVNTLWTQAFCSAHFNEIEERCNYKAGGEPVIDWDYWINAQDFGEPFQMTVLGAELTDDNVGQADLQIVNFGDTTHTRLQLVLEDNRWKIDDFQTVGDSSVVSVRELMEQYLQDNP